MGQVNKKIYLNRNYDDVQPNCMLCKHVTSSSDEFCEECGKNFWAHFTLIVNEKKKKEDNNG